MRARQSTSIVQQLPAVQAVLATAILLAVAPGCTGATPANRELVQVLDSSGIQIVQNFRRGDSTVSVEPIEDLRIGVVDGTEEFTFHLVTGVATDFVGAIYVTDQSAHDVRVFDAEGRFLRRFSGAGEGPGEFTLIGRLFVWKDTVHVQNLERRYDGVLFDTAGKLLATYLGRLPDGTLMLPQAGGENGWFVTHQSLFPRGGAEAPGDVTQAEVTISRIAAADLSRIASRAAADSLVAKIATYSRSRIIWWADAAGNTRGSSPLFEPVPATAWDGRGFTYVSRGFPYLIDVYDASGALFRRIRRTADSVPVNDALVNDVLARARQYYESQGRTAEAYDALERRARLPRIGFVAATGRMRASADGWLWVERPDLEHDLPSLAWRPGAQTGPRHWDVFNPDGHYRHTIRLPPNYILHAVTREKILGVERDELGVQYVVRHALPRGK